MEVHISFQSFCSVQIMCSIGDAQAAEARVGPSSLDKMWVSIISRWTAAIEVHSPWPEVEVVEERKALCIVWHFSLEFISFLLHVKEMKYMYLGL